MSSRTKSTLITDDYFELIKRFPLVPIRNDRHLKEAHKIVDELSMLDEDKLSQGQAAYLEVIGDLTAKYEELALIEMTRDVTGLDVLKHLVDEQGLSGSDVGRIIGQRELGAKVLKGDRQISREHAKLLGRRFGIASEIFLRS